LHSRTNIAKKMRRLDLKMARHCTALMMTIKRTKMPSLFEKAIEKGPCIFFGRRARRHRVSKSMNTPSEVLRADLLGFEKGERLAEVRLGGGGCLLLIVVLNFLSGCLGLGSRSGLCFGSGLFVNLIVLGIVLSILLVFVIFIGRSFLVLILISLTFGDLAPLGFGSC